MAEIPIGTKIGQYEIVGKIGQGGMAAVYKAYQPSIDRYVAIKVLTEDLAKDINFVRRFEGEGRAVAALEHPHILPVYDFGSQAGTLYMVMRYIDTGTLADWLDKETYLSYAQVVKIIDDLAGALDYAHSRGIIHRDVKPSNVLIDQFDEPLLTDFGLAKMAETSPQSRLTRTGTVVGTATYMSPEQAADEPLDGRSDIYSLGVMLFELFTGQPPYEADTMVAIALKHLNEPTPSLRAINPGVPEPFEQIVFKAMEKWPADRYQTGGEMSRALQAALRVVGAETASRLIPKTKRDASEQADTAKLSRPRYRQSTGETTAPPAAAGPSTPVPLLKQPWLWGSIIAAIVTTVAVVAVLLLWLLAADPLPPESLVNSLPDNGPVIDTLGSLENRFPRSNHARQHFEAGLMYWWENPATTLDPIYVISDGGDSEQGSDWSQYKNTWTPDEPMIPNFCVGAQEPLGPVMGFGRLWCYNRSVQDQLGLPLAPEESSNNATIELFTGGVVFSIPDENQVWVLYNDGAWQKYDNIVLSE